MAAIKIKKSYVCGRRRHYHIINGYCDWVVCDVWLYERYVVAITQKKG